jgi:hypothetical protein
MVAEDHNRMDEYVVQHEGPCSTNDEDHNIRDKYYNMREEFYSMMKDKHYNMKDV